MIYFKIWNIKAKDYVRDDQNEVVQFDLITWGYYAYCNRLESMDGLEIRDCKFDQNEL